MKSITIHGMDQQMTQLINCKAKANGMSLNKTIKALLEESLGIKPKQLRRHESDFEGLCGVWSENDLAEFDEATGDMRRVDMGDWQ